MEPPPEHRALVSTAPDLEEAGHVDVAALDEALEREALLTQYRRCCDDWRHHDAIIWEMPLATVSANALIVWAAWTGNHAWLLTAAWAVSAFVCGVMSLGLDKQRDYARQVQARIRAIENQLGLPAVTHQSGPPGIVSRLMEWMLRGLAVGNAALAVIFLVDPGILM